MDQVNIEPIQVHRSHEICMGHRVVGHEGKCRHLHGHNYKFHFTVEAVADELDSVGRVVDFSVVKTTLCEWLEENWDHKFMHFKNDSMIKALIINRTDYDTSVTYSNDIVDFAESLIEVDFNPTAENIAHHLIRVVGPSLLDEHGLILREVTIEETSKCHVTVKRAR